MLTWILLLTTSFSFANFEIPTGLTAQDREKTLEIIGLGTSTKFLSNAYPLGGYSGLEVSLSVESIDVEEITKLGDTSKRHETVMYPKFTIGKGIFNNSDIFFHFIPFNETTGISKYGLSYRWSFYQSLFFPLNFSMILHANSANLDNGVITRNMGADITAGFMISELSVFFGGGWINSTGDFSSGNAAFSPCVTDTCAQERTSVESSHFLFGATYNISPFFIGVSVDRYKEAVFNVKAGLLL